MATLTKEQLDHFKEFGFLKVENLIDPEKIIDPVIEEYHQVLSNLADTLFEEGKITSKYTDLPFGERVIKIYAEADEVYNQFFDFSLPQGSIKKDTPFWAGPAVFNALKCESLLDAVESIIGKEIYSNPIQHVRIKIPEKFSPRDEDGFVKFGATPWHQDAGVATKEIDKTNMLTVWFPLMDADEENGCLQVVPGSHDGKVLTHCPGFNPKTGEAFPALSAQGLQIPPTLFKSEHAMSVPMKKGDALFLTKKTVHSSLPNISDKIRWSFDLRYQPIGQPTGREIFPGFVARSERNPENTLNDPKKWLTLWENTRDKLAAEEQFSFNRWDGDDPACA